MTYLKDAEITALNESKLSRTTPFAIYNVSHTQLSIARFYGGATFQGMGYTYIPTHDVLVRNDVVKFLAKHRKVKKVPIENRQEMLI